MIIIPSNITAVAGAVLSDDFNRADTSSGLGSNWTAINGVLGISSNAAKGATLSGGYASAYYNTVFPNADVTVTVRINSFGSSYIWVPIGSPSVGWVGAYVGASYSEIYGVGADGSGLGTSALGGPTHAGTGDGTVTFKRVGSTYTLLAADGSTIQTYTDSANSYPTSTCRYVGIGFFNTTQTVDDWAAN